MSKPSFAYYGGFLFGAVLAIANRWTYYDMLAVVGVCAILEVFSRAVVAFLRGLLSRPAEERQHG